MWGMYSGVKASEKHDSDPLLTPYRPKLLLQDMYMWGMYSGVKANENHDGGNEKIIGSSGGPLLTLYT